MDKKGLDLTRYRQILNGELKRIGGIFPACEKVGGDLPEMADTDTGNGIRFAVAEIKSQKRDKIMAAMRRIENRTYGVCVDCREAIPPVRLESAPWEPRCKKCEEARSLRASSGRRNSVGCYVQVRA